MEHAIPRHIGDSEEITAHGKTVVLKKIGRGSYFLKVKGEQRGRFGDREQIYEDVDYFLEIGALPREKISVA